MGLGIRKRIKNSIKERVLWAPHNVLAHPLMIILPRGLGNWVHNKTIPKNSELVEDMR